MSQLPSRRRFLQTLTLASGALFSAPLLSSTASAQEETNSPANGWTTKFGPYLQNPESNGISIYWTTASPGLAWVEYWPVNQPEDRKIVQDSEYGLRRLKTPDHSVTIKGLQPDTEYAYKVYTREKNGREPDEIEPEKGSTEKDGTFKTLNPEGATCHVFIANDTHGRGADLHALMTKGKAEDADLIFHNGDIVDYVSGENLLYEKVIQPVQDFISKVPFVYIRGNHEYRGHLATTVAKTFPPYKNGQYYGLLRQGPVCFLILDTGEDKADNRKELFGVTDWESYFDEEAEWLKTAVEDPLFKSAPYKVGLQHIPAIRDNNFTESRIKEKFMPLLAKGGLNILICAHTHRNIFVEAGSDPNVPFSVLVNDNKGYVTLKADQKEMTVYQFDKEGENLRELKFSPGKA